MDTILDYSITDTDTNANIDSAPYNVISTCALALQDINFKDESAPLFNLLSEPKGYSTKYQVRVEGTIHYETENSSEAHNAYRNLSNQYNPAKLVSIWALFYPYQKTHLESFLTVRLSSTKN